MAVVVHRWDVRGALPPEIVEEIRRAHRLRNQLVEMELRYAEVIADIWAAHPSVAETEEALSRADAAVGLLLERVSEHRRSTGERKVPKELRDELAAARKVRKEAKAAQRDAKNAAFDEVKPLIGAARDWRFAEQKRLYRESVDAGLYWATFNLVRDHHETAVKMVSKKRQNGQAAQMRFHRWDGSGTIAVQLQRGDGVGPRDIEALTDLETGRWRNVFGLVDYPADWDAMSKSDRRRHARRGVTRVRWRFGSGEHQGLVEIPVAVSRPLPDGAEVVAAQLTRRLVAGYEKASVAVTLRIPDPEPITDGRMVAVHVGWRGLDDGDIRVAVIEGCAPPPAELVDAGVVRWMGTWAEVRIPWAWRSKDSHLAEVAGERDRAHNVALASFVDWLSAESEFTIPDRDGEPVALQAHEVRRWRSPLRLADLVWNHGERLPTSLAEKLDEWRRLDRRLWQQHGHGVDRLAGRRKDMWRKVARWVADGAQTVVIDEWSIAEMVRKPDVAETDSFQAEGARRLARLASPGLLRAQVQRAVNAAGGEVVDPDGSVTSAHHGCGGALDPEERRKSLMVPCDRCGEKVDQDRNTVLWLRDQVRNP